MDDSWVDYLHLNFLGEHVLFSSLRLRSFSSFFLAAVLVSVLCLLERFLTVLSNKNVQPRAVPQSRLATAAWRGSLYGLVTLLRLLYMLVVMSNQLGVIAVVVVALSIGQFAIEYAEYQEPDSERQTDDEPLLRTSFDSHPPVGRPRARSKPDRIFIHPSESNTARADAFAIELGIVGDTELVKGNRADGQSWRLGKGREVARKMFGDAHHHPDASASVFDTGDDDVE